MVKVVVEVEVGVVRVEVVVVFEVGAEVVVEVGVGVVRVEVVVVVEVGVGAEVVVEAGVGVVRGITKCSKEILLSGSRAGQAYSLEIRIAIWLRRE